MKHQPKPHEMYQIRQLIIEIGSSTRCLLTSQQAIDALMLLDGSSHHEAQCVMIAEARKRAA